VDPIYGGALVGLIKIRIKDLIKQHNKGAVKDIYLQHIGEIHLHSAGKFTAEIGAQGDISLIR